MFAFAVLLLYPLSAVQMYHQIQNGKMPYSNEDAIHEAPTSGEAAEALLTQQQTTAASHSDVENGVTG